jgi:hypothetical protein
LAAIRMFFDAEGILYLLFATGVIRLYFVLIGKDRKYLFLDSLLFAAIGYTVAFFILKIFARTYVFPAVVAALPSLAYWTFRLQKRNRLGAVAIAFLLAVLAKDSICTSKSVVVDVWEKRDSDMKIVRAVADQYLKGNEVVVLLEPHTLNEDRNCGWWIDTVYNCFINYFLGYRADIIKKSSNPCDISEKSVILHYKSSNSEKGTLEKHDCLKNFYLFAKCKPNIDIYFSKCN